MIDKGVLYIVATPIGNLEDITARALATLAKVDVIAAEDTRHSQRLLTHFGIDKRLVAYHDHSSDAQTEKLLAMLDEGKHLALISDAGTPLISDPGYRIVQLARTRAIKVVPIPGVSAPITALCAAGLATDTFRFEGFLSAKSVARKAAFEKAGQERATTVFFESPHRIRDSIQDAIKELGPDQQAVLARELTKTFETFLGMTLQDIEKSLNDDDNQSRGEMVLMIAGAQKEDAASDLSDEQKHAVTVLSQALPTKQAATLASQITGAAKKKLYDYVLSLKKGDM